MDNKKKNKAYNNRNNLDKYVKYNLYLYEKLVISEANG